MTSAPRLSAVATKDARAVRTREALQLSLLKLLQAKPFEQVTVRDIAAGADINYATFFRHHATKESLLHEIAAEQVRTLSALMLPSVDASNVSAAALALCNHVEANRALWSTLLTGGAASILREELLKSAHVAATTRSKPNTWVPPELAISWHVSGTLEGLTWWLRQKNPVPPERVAQLLEHIIFMPVQLANQQFAATQARGAVTRKRKRK